MKTHVVLFASRKVANPQPTTLLVGDSTAGVF